MAQTIILTVHELPSRDGTYAGSTDKHVLIIRSSRTPFFDTARALISRGVSPNTILAMRHKGSPTTSLQAPIGVAAKLTVEERERRSACFAPWQPFKCSANVRRQPKHAIKPSAGTPAKVTPK